MFNYRKPMSPSERSLSRDVTATLVPAGDAVNLPAGTRVTITHRLGGNFTVVCDYGMFRINGADALFGIPFDKKTLLSVCIITVY